MIRHTIRRRGSNLFKQGLRDRTTAPITNNPVAYQMLANPAGTLFLTDPGGSQFLSGPT